MLEWGRLWQLFLAGRYPYQVDPPPQQHDLGHMDIPCPHCGALHWLTEKPAASSKCLPKFGMCCIEGKAQLPALEALPGPLWWLFTTGSCNATTFWDKIWKYNQALSFTSLGVDKDHSVNQGQAPPAFRIFGEVHHWSGALVPTGTLKFLIASTL